MAPEAISARVRGEKSQSRIEKPLLDWLNEAMAPETAGGGVVS